MRQGLHGLCDCILAWLLALNQHSSDAHKREFVYGGVSGRPECKVIGSSDKVHVVDALAITGDEGRASLRKAGELAMAL